MSGTVTIGHKDIKTGEMTSKVDMPVFGLGVYLMREPGECKKAVSHAIAIKRTLQPLRALYAAAADPPGPPQQR